MSQAQQLLRALIAANGWVSTSDLLRAVPCIVHSRISDLRAQGYLIEHRTVGKGAAGSQYRLLVPNQSTTSATSRTWSVGDYLKGAAA